MPGSSVRVHGAVMQPAYGGTTDGFIARFDAGLTTVRGTTYVGGSAMDVLHTVVVWASVAEDVNNPSAALLEGDKVRVVTPAPGYDLVTVEPPEIKDPVLK